MKEESRSHLNPCQDKEDGGDCEEATPRIRPGLVREELQEIFWRDTEGDTKVEVSCGSHAVRVNKDEVEVSQTVGRWWESKYSDQYWWRRIG